MKTYSVHFDIANKEGGGYDAKFNAITKELRSTAIAAEWRYVTGTYYLILTDETAEQLADRIREHLNNQDSVFVMEANLENTSGWVPEHVWEWIKQHSRQSISTYNPAWE